MTVKDQQKIEIGKRTDAVRRAFELRYPAYQYQIVEFVSEHLADLSRVFRGDLQQMMVLAIIGQVYLRAYKEALLATGGDHPGQLNASISASRIADVTGIPRQTVRRKLSALITRGWIEKMDDATFRLVVTGEQAAARHDLDAVDQRSIDRVARLFCGLEKILQQP